MPLTPRRKTRPTADPGIVPLGNRNPVQPVQAFQGKLASAMARSSGIPGHAFTQPAMLLQGRGRRGGGGGARTAPGTSGVRRPAGRRVVRSALTGRETVAVPRSFGGGNKVAQTGAVQDVQAELGQAGGIGEVVSSGAKIRAQQEFDLQQARQQLGVVPPPPGRRKKQKAATPEQQAEIFKTIGDRFGHAWKMDDIARAREHIEDWFSAGGTWNNMPAPMEYLARQIAGAQGGETPIEEGLAAEKAGEAQVAEREEIEYQRGEQERITAGRQDQIAQATALMRQGYASKQPGVAEATFHAARARFSPEILSQVPEFVDIQADMVAGRDPFADLETKAKEATAQTAKNQTAAVTAIREQWTAASNNPVAQQEIYEQAQQIYDLLPPTEQRRLDKIIKSVERRKEAGKRPFLLPDEAVTRYRTNATNELSGKGVMTWDQETGRLNLLAGKEAALPDFELEPPEDLASTYKVRTGAEKDTFILSGGSGIGPDTKDKEYRGVLPVYGQILKSIKADQKRFGFSEKAAIRMAQEAFLSAISGYPHIVKALTGPKGPPWARTGGMKKKVDAMQKLRGLADVLNRILPLGGGEAGAAPDPSREALRSLIQQELTGGE